MMWLPQMLMGAAGLSAGALVAGGVYAALLRHQIEQRREAALRSAAGMNDVSGKGINDANSYGSACIQYMQRLSMRLATGSIHAFSPCVNSGRARSSHGGTFFCEHSSMAGLEDAVSVEAFCEASFRMCLAGCLAGAVFGTLFSNEMTMLLGVLGLTLGRLLPACVVRQRETDRGLEAGRHLSEMLEVVSLGLRSGLTFDRSFALYGQHFDSEFAQSCAAVYRRWSLGLSTREEALRMLARSYSCKQLEGVVESVIRSLKLGSALAGPLEEAADQARLSYRTELEERVAKAPVKMMLPTGMLILPAMLLLVMGPILLELTQGF